MPHIGRLLQRNPESACRGDHCRQVHPSGVHILLLDLEQILWCATAHRTAHPNGVVEEQRKHVSRNFSDPQALGT